MPGQGLRDGLPESAAHDGCGAGGGGRSRRERRGDPGGDRRLQQCSTTDVHGDDSSMNPRSRRWPRPTPKLGALVGCADQSDKTGHPPRGESPRGHFSPAGECGIARRRGRRCRRPLRSRREGRRGHGRGRAPAGRSGRWRCREAPRRRSRAAAVHAASSPGPHPARRRGGRRSPRRRSPRCPPACRGPPRSASRRHPAASRPRPSRRWTGDPPWPARGGLRRTRVVPPLRGRATRSRAGRAAPSR